MASRGAKPSSCCATMAKSIINMAFFLTMPMSRMIPINAMMVRSSPNSMRASSAPMPAGGRGEKSVRLGKMREIIDGDRAGLHFDFGDGRQRHLAPARRRHVDGLQGIDRTVGGRIRLHDDAVLIRLGKYRGNDALAKSIIKGIVDRSHAYSQARGAVAVDVNVGRE